MKKILIIGGTGFLGKRIVYFLKKEKNSQLGLLIRDLANRKIRFEKNIKLFGGDILNKNSLIEPIKCSDIIIHNAGKVSYTAKNKNLLYRLHVDGTRNVVELCKKFNKIRGN